VLLPNCEHDIKMFLSYNLNETFHERNKFNDVIARENEFIGPLLNFRVLRFIHLDSIYITYILC
jgi:hypothetical protein